MREWDGLLDFEVDGMVATVMESCFCAVRRRVSSSMARKLDEERVEDLQHEHATRRVGVCLVRDLAVFQPHFTSLYFHFNSSLHTSFKAYLY